jgi:predicted transcriptional regulator
MFSLSICEKTATLLGVSRATVSNIVSAYTNHGKTKSTKRNSGQKSTRTERDGRTLRRTVSKNHRTTAAQVKAELNIHPGDPVSTKTVQHELHKSNIHGRAAFAEALISESKMLRCVNDSVTTIKPEHHTTGNVRVIWSDESSFTLFPTRGRVYNMEEVHYHGILLIQLLPFMAKLP